MKAPLVLFPLVLISIYTNSLFCQAAAESVQPAAVFGVDGKEVRTDLFYYIRPANNRGKDRGGGLGLRSIGNDSCPLVVIQETNELRDGLPLTFSPAVAPKDNVVRVSTDLNIQVAFPDTCNQPTVWRVDVSDKSKGRKFVNLGGVIGNPGPETLGNWFKIEKVGDHGNKYKLVYCPTVCSYCKVNCKNLGIVYQNGLRRLALSHRPFKVIFTQA
ncbi:kunitz trypsin inhibitor 5-like [Coffea arabica]|uniref:Kunitz trypsin inhibitor 5-like n=1 Tax=Coffea arabica TaxID=13443 RepID=A0A6P6X2Y0_COFAR|nr:miraculin-like [Coffea arabica]